MISCVFRSIYAKKNDIFKKQCTVKLSLISLISMLKQSGTKCDPCGTLNL